MTGCHERKCDDDKMWCDDRTWCACLRDDVMGMWCDRIDDE